MNMNELVRLGGLPRSKLPSIDTTCNTAPSYFEAFADLNIEHLIHQRNHAVESAADYRRKFEAIGRFSVSSPGTSDAPIHPSRTGLSKSGAMIYGRLMYYSKRTCSIVGVVYWEFTYAAPAEFLNAPPCWLLIEKPEFWPKGIEDWTRGFDHRLKTFLRAMRACEDKAIQKGRLKEDQRLSGPMQQSWESGYCWIIYAVLHSFAFDAIYWQKIHPRFFGPTESPEEAWKDRLGLVDEKEKYEMEQLVARKLEEMKTRDLAWDQMSILWPLVSR
ncbi:hypothetical protein IFM61392_06031 [Aspergillus lentulus]|nr:hypothetical protein IFM61392_06031 [Aspergillus lentulus]